MDFSEVYFTMQSMKKNPLSSILSFLSETLWGKRPFGRRSNELTPLYIRRTSGPRNSRHFTSHSFWEFTCVLDGTGRMICKKPLSMQKHTVCLVPPGFAHCEQSTDGMDTIWIGLKGARMKSVTRNSILWVKSKKICDAFEQIWLLAEHEKGIIGPELDGILLTITGMFFRMALDGAVEQNNDCIERAIHFFNEHFAENISIPDTARRFGYSEGYFQHMFRLRIGMAPVAYLTTVRCRHAAHLLWETNWSIARIAELAGFADQFYFSRTFRKIHGYCPREFRKIPIKLRKTGSAKSGQRPSTAYSFKTGQS